MTNDNEHIYRHIDEAELKKVETEKELRIKEMELEERENNKNRKSRTIIYGVALFLVIIGAFICIAGILTGFIVAEIGMMIALFTAINSQSKKEDNKKRKINVPSIQMKSVFQIIWLTIIERILIVLFNYLKWQVFLMLMLFHFMI